jgi:hypothetical protein
MNTPSNKKVYATNRAVPQKNNPIDQSFAGGCELLYVIAPIIAIGLLLLFLL